MLYSGTVAAAMEGRFLDKPAMAISLCSSAAEVDAGHFQAAAAVARWLLGIIDRIEVPPRTVFNVNIPDLPAAEIRGLRLTVLGQRLRGENPIRTQNPRGKTAYWIGRAGGPVAQVEGSDFHAVANGYVSLTPIHADMTQRDNFREMERMVAGASDAMSEQLSRLTEECS